MTIQFIHVHSNTCPMQNWCFFQVQNEKLLFLAFAVRLPPSLISKANSFSRSWKQWRWKLTRMALSLKEVKVTKTLDHWKGVWGLLVLANHVESMQHFFKSPQYPKVTIWSGEQSYSTSFNIPNHQIRDSKGQKYKDDCKMNQGCPIFA